MTPPKTQASTKRPIPHHWVAASLGAFAFAGAALTLVGWFGDFPRLTDWDGNGIAPDQDGALARLHRLSRVRIDTRFLDDLTAAEARTLSSEARAVGDEDFAADLEARAHESAYR